MANPIQRLIRYVFDRGSAAKAEADAKESLGRIGSSFETLKKRAALLAGTLAGVFSVRALFNFGRESVRVATEATAIWGRLEKAVESTGIAYADVREEIEAAATAMQDATVVGDEDFARVLADLMTTSGDYAASLRNVSVVADLAAAKNLDLGASAQLVGRAMVGQTATLTRYGIIVREGEDAVEAIRRQFAGFAAAEGATFEGMLLRINNELGDFRQAVGDALIEAAGGTSVLETVVATLRSMVIWTNTNRAAIASWGVLAIDTVRAVAESFRFMFRVAFNVGQILGSSFELAFMNARQSTAEFVNWAAETMSRIPGINVEFRLNAMTPDAFAAEQKRLGDQIARDTRDLGGALMDLGNAYRAVGASAVAAALAQTRAGEAGRSAAPDALPAGGGGVRIPDVPVRVVPDAGSIADTVGFVIRTFDDLRLSIPNQIMADMNREMRLAESMTLLTGEAYASLQTEADLLTWSLQRLLESGLSPTDRRLQALAGRLREVQAEQALVTRQNEIMASVAATTGEVLNAVMGAGIGPLAAGKAKQNAIMAAEQTAMGLVALLNPFTAAKAGGHFAAASQFAGIAAAWGALAGATGGFSTGGGRSGMGGFSGGRDEGGARAASMTERAPELNVYLVGEGFDAVNPRVQRVVQGAIREAQASTGPNARVRIYRRASLPGEA